MEGLKERIKKEIDNVLKTENLNLIRLILFGSRAKEHYSSESDWDILVVVKEDLNPSEKKNVWLKIYKALHRNLPGHSFDIFIKSKQEFEDERAFVNTLSNEATEEGITL